MLLVHLRLSPAQDAAVLSAANFLAKFLMKCGVAIEGTVEKAGAHGGPSRFPAGAGQPPPRVLFYESMQRDLDEPDIVNFLKEELQRVNEARAAERWG